MYCWEEIIVKDPINFEMEKNQFTTAGMWEGAYTLPDFGPSPHVFRPCDMPEQRLALYLLLNMLHWIFPCTCCRHTNQARMEWQNIGQDRKNSTLVSVNMTIVAHDAKFWPEIEFVKE